MELLNSVKKERDRLLNTKIKTQKVGLPFFLKKLVAYWCLFISRILLHQYICIFCDCPILGLSIHY
jgi:hypothetical protein